MSTHNTQLDLKSKNNTKKENVNAYQLDLGTNPKGLFECILLFNLRLFYPVELHHTKDSRSKRSFS